MKIAYQGKVYQHLGWADVGCRLRFQQEGTEEIMEMPVSKIMSEDDLQVICSETDSRSALVLKELKENNAEYEKRVQEIVFQNPDRTAENHDKLWGLFWKTFGRDLADKREFLEDSFIRELRREVKVGDGMTIHLWSDRDPCTVIARTAKTLTVQEDKAERDPDFVPEWITGGFSAICTNKEDQKWKISRDPEGKITKFFWSEKYGAWRAGGDGSIHATMGRNKFYDYDF